MTQDAKAAPTLLSGGNPQIAKGYGDAPVQAWIAAAPGWKGDAARRLDALIARARFQASERRSNGTRLSTPSRTGPTSPASTPSIAI